MNTYRFINPDDLPQLLRISEGLLYTYWRKIFRRGIVEKNETFNFKHSFCALFDIVKQGDDMSTYPNFHVQQSTMAS
jgi:hypothetical protein